jgi:hypothetical protein
MKKEVKNGQGFICEDLKEKIRIWEKLVQHRYPVFADGNDRCYRHIVWDDGEFVETNQKNIEPLNEAEFFGENEWTPKPGEWVEASLDGIDWDKRQYMCTIDGIHFCVNNGEDYRVCAEFSEWAYIRQIPLETMTLQQAQEKLREFLNNPNLIITP